MNFEELQKAWQSQVPAAKLTVSPDLLFKEVRRNQQHFRATIFWRDVREVAVAFLLFVYFFHRGWHNDAWTDCLVGLACLEVGTFMVVDRLIQRRKRPAASDSLQGCIARSLHEVNHQIWLLRNVLWWYLSPIILTLGISVGVSMWHSRHSGSAVIGWVVYVLMGALLYWGIYHLNQFAVRRSLEPRRQELENLKASLNELSS